MLKCRRRRLNEAFMPTSKVRTILCCQPETRILTIRNICIARDCDSRMTPLPVVPIAQLFQLVNAGLEALAGEFYVCC